MSEQEAIVVRGARVNNLKNVSFSIPHNQLTVVTGVSGSGKSSLAFDTIYAEGQRRYVESLSAYARQFLERMNKPDVDEVLGIAPAIAINQKNSTRNPRSTVATQTEIYDYLRLLFARVGTTICDNCQQVVKRDTPQSIADEILALPAGTRFYVLFPASAGTEYVSEEETPKKKKPKAKTVNVQAHLMSLMQRGFTRLFHTMKYNNRFQLAEVYLGTSTNSWNRGALSFYYGNAMRTSGNPYANGLDNNGNVTMFEHWVPLNDAITQSVIYRDKYEYDALNRIQQVKGYFVNTANAMSQIYQQTYAIDAWGNRQIDANGAQTWGGVNNRTFTLPTQNGVPTTNRFGELASDWAGNMTSDITIPGDSMTFDGANRMTRAIVGSITSHYVYDAGGQRVRRIINGAETWQVFGFEGELLAEYPVASGAPSTYAQREYAYRGGDMLVVAGCDVARWLIKDQIGTPRILADWTGSLANVKRHDYLPYGEEVTGAALRSATYGYAADCLRQDFTTYERDDETGLDYAQARYYASKQGRFISVDPDISSAGVSDPQTWNRYAYVGNHPLVLTDPTGLRWYLDKKNKNFVWSDRTLGQDVLDFLGWEEVTAATQGVRATDNGGFVYESVGGNIISLRHNNQNPYNITAAILQEIRLENMQASKEMIEARTNAIILDFISKSEQGAEILLTGGKSITIRAAIKV